MARTALSCVGLQSHNKPQGHTTQGTVARAVLLVYVRPRRQLRVCAALCSVGCATLSCSAGVNPLPLRAASLIPSQRTWFILSPSDRRQGFSVTWLAFPSNSQPPAGREQTCRKAKTYKQPQKTYLKSYDCLCVASKINTFGSYMRKTDKWKKFEKNKPFHLTQFCIQMLVGLMMFLKLHVSLMH